MKNRLASVVALAALAGFAWFVIYMLQLSSATEVAWARAVYVFGGVEAIAFAAAGFLFGREVHRERAEQAEKRADQSEQGAANGRSLAEVIRAKRTAFAAKTPVLGASSPAQQTAQAELDELIAVANQ